MGDFLLCLLFGVFLFILFFKPILFIYIPIFIILVVYRLFCFVLHWLKNKIISFFIEKIIEMEINLFERAIKNKGIKENVDVALCHDFFNKTDFDSISLLFDIYSRRVKVCLQNDSYDEEQAERYLNLLEIMQRSLSFKLNN